jgi:hypothetical protein
MYVSTPIELLTYVLFFTVSRLWVHIMLALNEDDVGGTCSEGAVT